MSIKVWHMYLCLKHGDDHVLCSRKLFTESISLPTILNVQYSEETFSVSGWWPEQCYVVLWYRMIRASFVFLFLFLRLSIFFNPNFI